MMFEVYCEGRASYLFFTEDQALLWIDRHKDVADYRIRLYDPKAPQPVQHIEQNSSTG